MAATNTIRHIYSSRPPPQNIHEGMSPPPLQTSPLKGGEGFTTLISAQRSTEGKYSLTMWCCSSDCGESLCAEYDACLCVLGVCSSAACQPVRPLERYLNVPLQQCAHSMTSLFVKIDYFKWITEHFRWINRDFGAAACTTYLPQPQRS